MNNNNNNDNDNNSSGDRPNGMIVTRREIGELELLRFYPMVSTMSQYIHPFLSLFHLNKISHKSPGMRGVVQKKKKKSICVLQR